MLVPAWDKRTGRRYDVTEAAFDLDPNLVRERPAAVAAPKPPRAPARAPKPADQADSTETPATGGEE